MCFGTAASLIGIFPFLLRLSYDICFLEGDCKLFQYIPAFSLIFASFCGVRNVYYILLHAETFRLPFLFNFIF